MWVGWKSSPLLCSALLCSAQNWNCQLLYLSWNLRQRNETLTRKAYSLEICVETSKGWIKRRIKCSRVGEITSYMTTNENWKILVSSDWNFKYRKENTIFLPNDALSRQVGSLLDNNHLNSQMEPNPGQRIALIPLLYGNHKPFDSGSFLFIVSSRYRRL